MRRFGVFLSILLASQWASAAVSDGYVVRVDHSEVYIDWGKTAGVQAGDHFAVYREGAALKHPVSGELLGHAEESVATATIDRVDDKFSVGHLDQSQATAVPGDRTRLTASNRIPATLSVVSTSTTVTSNAPQELWRSQPLPDEVVSIAVGKLVASQTFLVAASAHKISVFKWTGTALEPAAQFQNASYAHWLSVDTADLENQGHERIFATTYLDGMHRGRVVVLELKADTLQEVAHLDGFARKIIGPDGQATMALQTLSLSSELRVLQPASIKLSNSGYTVGSLLEMRRRLNDDQLFGFTFGRWDGANGLALLQGGEQLRFFLKDSKWSANEAFGGSKNDFLYEGDRVAAVYPRLIAVPGEQRDTLLVPHNFPELGVRTTYLKFFKRGELTAVRWNGLEMAPVWRLPTAGYLADFASTREPNVPPLWLALTGPGSKSVLIGYALDR